MPLWAKLRLNARFWPLSDLPCEVHGVSLWMMNRLADFIDANSRASNKVLGELFHHRSPFRAADLHQTLQTLIRVRTLNEILWHGVSSSRSRLRKIVGSDWIAERGCLQVPHLGVEFIC